MSTRNERLREVGRRYHEEILRKEATVRNRPLPPRPDAEQWDIEVRLSFEEESRINMMLRRALDAQ